MMPTKPEKKQEASIARRSIKEDRTMSKDTVDAWIFRVMEIRKNPSCATIEEIHKLASEFICGTFYSRPRNHIADLGQILSNTTDTYNHGET